MWNYESDSKNRDFKNGRLSALLLSSKKFCFLLLTLLCVCLIFLGTEQEYLCQNIAKETLIIKQYDGTWRNLSQDEKSRLSVLGRILYLEEERPPQKKQPFLVLFWKYGNYIKNRHLNYYTKETHNPLEYCSVNNCKFSFDDKDLTRADLVVFHLHRTKGLQDLPAKHNKTDQIWTFLTDESPHHTFLSKSAKMQLFNGRFNWSMSYRMDSDIPVPYGRTRKFLGATESSRGMLEKKRRDRLVAILGSNCGGKNHRWQYVKKLNKTIHVDVYGGCGNKTALSALLLSSKKFCFLLLTLLCVCLIFLGTEQEYLCQNIAKETLIIKQYDGTWRNLSQDEKSRLSVLGRILYLEEERPPQKKQPFLVLFWKYGNYIKNRHLNYYTKETHNPLEYCSVNNCKFSFDDKDLTRADLVVFHLHRTKGLQDLPAKHNKTDQIWTFLTDESPHHTFLSKSAKMQLFNGRFNWSMSYRMDSDIPVPYGRTRKFLGATESSRGMLEKKRRDRLVAILGSNCGGKNHRWQYVKKLNKTIHVDVYGGCGNKTACPGHFKSDCPVIDDYLFYLSFENSDCKEYITEKVFWNGYHKNAIPIVMGYNKKTYDKLLPPNSYLHVDDYASPSDLGRMILSLNETGKYKDYFKWKSNYEVVDEHGYFKSKSYHLCRICEGLNFNKRTPKVYDKLEDYWSISKDCTDA